MSAFARPVISPSRGDLLSPDFELPDHRGETFRLFDALDPAAAVVVFYRGHWCPYCRRYLSKLQANLYRIEASVATLVAISPEPAATGAALARDLGLTFPLLSDADGRVIDLFRVRNSFAGGISGVPHPAVFIIDPAGQITFRSIDRNFKKRTTIRSILSALAAIRAAPVEVST